MNVRCTRCQALYSLEDVLFGGSDFKPLPEKIQVECGRCEQVFEAAVPGRLPRTSNPNLKPVRKDTPEKSARAETGERLARILKPRRPGDEPGVTEMVTRGAALAAFGDGAAARRERANRVRRWALLGGVVLLAVTALLLVTALKRKLGGGLGKEARAKVERAHQLLMMDDEQSLRQAAALFREAGQLAPGEAQPEADLAFATLLLAESHRDLAERLESAARDEQVQVARLEDEKPQGWEARVATHTERASKLVEERAAHVREYERRLGLGRAAASAAAEEDPDQPAVLRAQALFVALSDADKARALLDKAQRKAPRDALTLYARAAVLLAGKRSRDRQDAALSALAEAQQSEPRLLRAAYDAAAIAAERQQYGSARAGLQKVLEANARHERAKALLEALPKAQQ